MGGQAYADLSGEEPVIVENDGQFKFEKIPLGTKVLTVTAAGYEVYRSEVSIRGGKSESHAVRLVKSIQSDADEEVIALAASILGVCSIFSIAGDKLAANPTGIDCQTNLYRKSRQ